MSLFIYCARISFYCFIIVIEVNYTSKSKQFFTIVYFFLYYCFQTNVGNSFSGYRTCCYNVSCNV